MADVSANQLPLVKRLWIYQSERFPVFGHGLLIASFTFSAVSYSRICRGAAGFIDLKDFLIGVFATVTLFLLVRIFDEFKDQEDDRLYRTYLPVPRGLVSLSELKWLGIIVAGIQLAVIGIFQSQMIMLYLVVLGYLLLMGVEFFIPKWLKRHQMAYITSHMVIIPLVDIYASGLDWRLDGDQMHWGLAWFFGVSYLNGLVLEFGRKIRTPDQEEDGVVSYTGLYGTKGGTASWLVLMLCTMMMAMGASWFAGYSILAYLVLGGFYVICAIPGILFMINPTEKLSKYIEYASALWTMLMYLSLGGIPMVSILIS